MSKKNSKQKVTEEIIQANENNKIIKRSKTVDVILKLIPIVISVIALVMTFINFQYTKNNYFYNRIFQPLTYEYDFDIDNENHQKFGQYIMPIIKCKINTNSGFINKIMVITTDENTVDTVYEYNSKSAKIGLLNGIGIDFDLRFNNVFEYENCIYQYIFIYVESTNNDWSLDCVQVMYNEDHTIESIVILDTTDLIRLNSPNTDEIYSLILTDYEMAFNEIKNINK